MLHSYHLRALAGSAVVAIALLCENRCACGQVKAPPARQAAAEPKAAPLAERVDALFFEFRKLAPKAKWQQADAVRSELVALGRPVVPALIAAVRERRPGLPADLRAPGQEWIAHYAIQALGDLGDARAVPVLIEVLGDDYSQLTREAIQALRKLGTEAVPALLAALNDRREGVVDSAARALGEIGDGRAVEPLLAALVKHPKAQSGVVTALGQLRVTVAVKPLVALLKAPKADVTYEVLVALGEIGDRRVLGIIAAYLNDKDMRIRTAAAQALGQLGDVRAVAPLLAALRTWEAPRIGVRSQGMPAPDYFRPAVVQALADLGAAAVEPLLAALADQSLTARQGAITALGKIGDVRAVDPLIARLRGEDLTVAPAALWALGEIGHLRALRPMLEALNNRVTHYQDGGKALAKLGERAVPGLIEALKDDHHLVRICAAIALAELAVPQAQEPLLAAWREERNRQTVLGTYAYQGLMKCADARSGRSLLALLKDKDKWNRARAADVLAYVNDPRAVPPLIAALRDRDKDVRMSAVAALKAIGDDRAVEPLTGLLHDPDESVRQEVIKALGDLGDGRAVAPLIAALKDNNLWTPLGDALGKIGEPAVAPLIAALEDKDYYVRSGAAEALGKTHSRRAVEPLIKALGDTEWWVRLRAAASLGKIGDPRAVPPLLALHKDMVANHASAALWLIGPPAVQPLSDALKDKDRGVRFQAAFTLGQLADRRAVEPLLTALHDADKDVRQQVVIALGIIGDARARKALQALLEREQKREVRETAVRVLKAIP